MHYNKVKTFLFYITFIFFTIAIDQITKYEVIKMMYENDFAKVEVVSFFNIILVMNYGISFGILNNHDQSQIIWMVITVIICSFLTVWLYKNKEKWLRLAIAMVLGGAIGNLLDRTYYGAVIDFLDFHLFGYHYPAFNIADSFIVLGALLMVWRSYSDKTKF
jgi:signal peptidase II